VRVGINAHADMLFHRWNVDAVAEKSNAAKGSKAKKSDDVESYVWRTDRGTLGIPTEYLRMSIVMAAKYSQDPRSPRKSAMDLFKAGLIGMTDLYDTGLKKWDYEDRRRVQVQRNGVTRTRPALRDWKAEFVFLITTPEYISPEFLQQVIGRAGLLVGIGDFRPTFGRFGISRFEVLKN